jgi:hypothetical protein
MMNERKNMKEIYKSKSVLREETKDAVEAFLRAGGSIEVVKSRKAPKSKMKAKNSRGSNAGTSGFAVGYPRRSI